jgi:UDP-N-acetylmuramoyl-tripeptide--D-alanyl-D-alanine ligase
LAATAVGIQFKIPVPAIKAALEGYIPQNNRSQLIKDGSNTYILDAYNANPSSMQGGISDFADYPAANKVLLLGDMFEMGDEAAQEHKAILDTIKWNSFSNVGLAGVDFYSFKDHYPGHFFKSTIELKEWFSSQHFENTTFYLKGSRGMKMESIIEK